MTKNKIILIVLGVVILGGGVFAWWWWTDSPIDSLDELRVAIGERRALNCKITTEGTGTFVVQADGGWRNIKILRDGGSSVLILNKGEAYQWSDDSSYNFKYRESGAIRKDVESGLGQSDFEVSADDDRITVKCGRPTDNDFTVPSDIEFIDRGDEEAFSVTWPSNRYAQQVPRPQAGAVIEAVTTKKSLVVSMRWTRKNVIDYVAILEQNGFVAASNTLDTPRTYVFHGIKSGSSYSVRVGWMDGNFGSVEISERK